MEHKGKDMEKMKKECMAEMSGGMSKKMEGNKKKMIEEED